MIGEFISHYKVIEKLGEGGMGEVYLAEDTKLNRQVALKFLPSRLAADSSFKARFMREAQAAAGLNHPNIITVHEVAEYESRPYIAMEYVEGESLKNLIVKKELPVEQVIDLAVQICEGLAKAHLMGIVHRDLKSQNVLIDQDGRVRICDFGLAKVKKDAMLTKLGTTVGTVAYMSPEQARGEKVDHRTDIWALGVVLYEMLTGEMPFKGEYDQAVIYSILNEEPAPMTSSPIELKQLVGKALAKNPDDRYQTASEVLGELRSVKEGFESGVTKTLRASASTSPSVAVLPFTNLSADKEQEYFCDGMAEEIINALAHLEGLRVVARTSSFSFRGKEIDVREVGRKLRVGAVVEGSVRKVANRLCIGVQLVNVADGYHLWSERYDRDISQSCCPDDIFCIQDEISLAVVDKLKVKLLGKEKARLVNRHTQNLDAYSLYLKGRYFWNKRTEESLTKAIDYFKQAIEKDPDYALAYVGLADSHILLAEYSLVPPKDAFPRAKAAVMKALEIEETLAEAHTSLAYIKTLSDWDWMGAEKEFKQAIEFNPGYATAHQWYAEHLTMTGQYAEAIQEFKRAKELDPLSLIIGVASAVTLFCGTRWYERVIEECQKVLEMDPNFGGALNVLGMVYRERAMYEEAIAAFRKARTFDEGNTWVTGELGHVYAVSGKRSEAQQIVGELEQLSKRSYVPPDNIALVYLGLGDKDLTFEYLEKAYQDRCVGLSWLNADPIFKSLRQDPRFVTLLKRIGLEK